MGHCAWASGVGPATVILMLQPDAAPPSRVRAFAARHPVAAFLTMVLLIAYPVMGVLVLIVHGVIPGAALLQRLPVGPDELAGLTLTVGALLPSALYVTWAAEGRPGLVRLLRRMIGGGSASVGG